MDGSQTFQHILKNKAKKYSSILRITKYKCTLLDGYVFKIKLAFVNFASVAPEMLVVPVAFVSPNEIAFLTLH